jgi:hypothetical protein
MDKWLEIEAGSGFDLSPFAWGDGVVRAYIFRPQALHKEICISKWGR